jgi:hypothetical protein
MNIGPQKQPHSVNQVEAQAKATVRELNEFESRLVKSLEVAASRLACVDRVAVVTVQTICIACRGPVDVWFDDLPFSVTKFVRCQCGALVRCVLNPKSQNTEF